MELMDITAARKLIVAATVDTVDLNIYENSHIDNPEAFENEVIFDVVNTLSLEEGIPGAEQLQDLGDELSSAYYTVLVDAERKRQADKS